MDFMQLLFDVNGTLDMVVKQYGVLIYAVLFAIVFCETGLVVMFFLPGDSLLFIAGAFCANGHMNVWVLMILLIIAAVSGNTCNYWIGEAIGHKALTNNYRWINQDGLKRTHVFFEKHGGKTIILSRFVPVVRTFAPFVAGISDMTFARFQYYNVIGALAWVISLVGAGYAFGNVPWVTENINTIAVVGVSAAVFPLFISGLWKLGSNMLKKNK